ncbi:MAG: amidohydrolase family protein [Pseudomonadota bacterium]
MFYRILSALAALGLMLSTAAAEPVLYYNFHHIDSASRQVVPNRWMVVRDGTIQELGSGSTPESFSGKRVDLDGRWALPGLIDGHGHITSGPHKIRMVDGQPLVTIDSVDDVTRYNALMALAFGVTTVRNPGGDPGASSRYDEHVATGSWLGPSALHAGAVIQPPPFGGNAFAYPQSRDQWFAEARRQAALGMTYFKLYQSLTEEELALGIEAAHAHGLKAIAHLDRVSWQKALELGIDGLEHALPTSTDLLPETYREAFEQARPRGSQYLHLWFQWVDYNAPPMRQLFETLKTRQVTLNLTLLVNHMVAYSRDMDQVIDADAISYLHPKTWEASAGFLRMGGMTWTPEDFETARATLPKVGELARRLFEAGQPLLIGTDGNGGGPLMAIEMQLHVDAGIPLMDVLDLATRRSAETLGLPNIGEIAPGKEADVLFVDADPQEGLAALRQPYAVLNNGRWLLHADLVQQARELLVGQQSLAAASAAR